MSRMQFVHSYQYIISTENLLEAWQEFLTGKRSRHDVQLFERNLMSNIFALRHDLVTKKYQHSAYEAFNISDPKPRNIHKATVRDRLLHHALYRVLYPFFDRTFIADSYSCRLHKGTHAAMKRFRVLAFQASSNHTKTLWVLKCDIRKFFASIDHTVLKRIMNTYISDPDTQWLNSRVIDSFHSTSFGQGLPLGNLTSQLFVNIYMNEFDQFVKHQLKAKYYIRYADDFVILSQDRNRLNNLVSQISKYLSQLLRLTLHPNKVSLKTLASGVDFLGWVHFSRHRVLRTVTKRRIIRRVGEHPTKETVQSYLGLLDHGQTYKLKRKIMKEG